MKLLRQGLRKVSLALSCVIAVLLLPAIASAEKVSDKVAKPAANQDVPPVNRTGEALWGGKWYAVQVLEEKDGKFYVHYNTYSDTFNEWLPKDRLRFPDKPAGKTKCEVEWSGKWYPAHVIAQEKDQWKIKYDDHSDTWNEWVGKERIRFPAPAEKKIAPAKEKPAKDTPAKAAKQTQAEVLWNGTWYPAEVLETKDGKFSIHYTGYGDNWNEWVGQDRIRLLPRPAPKPGDRKDQDEKQPSGQH